MEKKSINVNNENGGILLQDNNNINNNNNNDNKSPFLGEEIYRNRNILKLPRCKNVNCHRLILGADYNNNGLVNSNDNGDGEYCDYCMMIMFYKINQSV